MRAQPYFPVGDTAGLPLSRLVYLRDLIRELVVRDIKLRYNRSILGVAWSLLVPLAQFAILSFVFGVVLPLGTPHFSTFLFTGLLPWTWFQTSLLGVAATMPQNRDLLRQVGFPAGVLPAITVTSQLIHFLLALPILGVFLWADGRPITMAVAALPLVIGVQFALTLGVAYFVAPLQAIFHDTQHLLNLALMLLFYLCPIFYAPSAVPPPYSAVYRLNPLVHLLAGYRSIFVDGAFPALSPLLIEAAASGLLLYAGYRFYIRLHYRLVQEL